MQKIKNPPHSLFFISNPPLPAASRRTPHKINQITKLAYIFYNVLPPSLIHLPLSTAVCCGFLTQTNERRRIKRGVNSHTYRFAAGSVALSLIVFNIHLLLFCCCSRKFAHRLFYYTYSSWMNPNFSIESSSFGFFFPSLFAEFDWVFSSFYTIYWILFYFHLRTTIPSYLWGFGV